jgi:hypothetical protein
LTVDDLATLRDIRADLHAEGVRMGMPFVQRGLNVLDKLLAADVCAEAPGQLCLSSHYAVIVEAHKDAEIYQQGDEDCPNCLARMVVKHQAIADLFRSKLAEIGEVP